MSLQKFTSSGFCKAVSAFLFGLMILSACQETAQHVLNNSAPPVADESSQPLSQRQLTSEEQSLAAELADDVDTQFLIESNRTIYVKLKMAAENNRTELGRAMTDKDNKKVLKLLNISNEEFKTLNEQRIAAMQRWQNKFASKRDLIQKTRDKYLPVCKTCKETNAQDINVTLDRIARTELPPKIAELRAMAGSGGLPKEGSSMQACFWFWQWALLVIAEAGCAAGFFACLGAFGVLDVVTLGISAAATPVQIALCSTITAGCMALAYCGVCGGCNER